VCGWERPSAHAGRVWREASLPGGVKASGERRVRAGCASERGNGLTRGASVSEAGCARAGGGRPWRGPCRRGGSGRWAGRWCAGGSGQARMRAACGVRRVCQVGSGAQRECDARAAEGRARCRLSRSGPMGERGPDWVGCRAGFGLGSSFLLFYF